jgi:hypothetical protein
MKRLLICCCLPIICYDAVSQRTVDVDKEANTGAGAFNYVYTVAGVPFVMAKFARVVDGSPFFNKEMMRGAIILSEGKEYKNMLIRLNLLESQVNYIGEKQLEMIATSPIKEVVLWDTVSNRNFRFVYSAYIAATKKPEIDFYELLQAGKAELYKQYKKRMMESKPYGSATIEQTIQTELRYFILLNGQWTRVRKLKDLVAVFNDKKNEVQNLISDKKINDDTEVNFETITTFYNSLFIMQ